MEDPMYGSSRPLQPPPSKPRPQTKPSQRIGSSALQDASTIPDYVVLFTVIMASAFVSDLFSPSVEAVLHSNKWAKHAVALSLLALTVVWGKQAESWGVMAAYAIAAYLWYLALIDMNAPQFFTVLLLLVIVFVVSHLRGKEWTADDDGNQTTEDASDFKAWQYWVSVIGMSGAAALTSIFIATNTVGAFMGTGT